MNELTVHQATATLNRRETLDSREYLVAPVVAVREGVLNGELATAEDIGRYVDTWNGIPLPIGHPEQDGRPVSANSPRILETQTVGRFWNATFTDNALRGEIWVDVEKATRLGGEALTALQKLENGEPLEVSTAYFNDLEPTAGTFQGITYNGIQRNLRPDHLALLPNTIGACSWENGCGAPRVNEKQTKKGGMATNMFEKMKNAFAKMLSVNQEDVSFGETGDLLEQAMIHDTGDAMRFLIREVFDDYFIYQESTANGFDGRLIKRTYEMDDEKRITLGAAVEVKKVVTYEPTSPSANEKESGASQDESREASNEEELSTNEEEQDMDKKQLVNGLIANESNTFTENDRSFLEGLQEEQLQKMKPQEPATNKEDCGCQGEPAANKQEEKKLAPSTNSEKTMDQWIQDIPDPETREFIINSRQKQQEHRQSLIQRMASNERCAFNEEELKGMATNQLEKLNRSMQVEDYSGMGGPSVNDYYQADNDTIPDAPSIVMAVNEEDKGGAQ